MINNSNTFGPIISTVWRHLASRHLIRYQANIEWCDGGGDPTMIRVDIDPKREAMYYIMMNKWLNLHMDGRYKVQVSKIEFHTGEDAMAFKIVWC